MKGSFRGAIKIIFIILVLACLAGDFFIARSLVPNSDSIQNYGQFLAIHRGNVLLQHWVLSSDNFYFTDDLPFLLLSFVFGSGLNLIYIVPFVTFCCFLVACFWLVARAAKTEQALYFGLFLILFLLGLPYAPWLDLMLRSAIHIGTITFCLFATLLIEPILSNRPFNRAIFLPYGLLVFVISFSDPFAEFFFVTPLLILVILRAWLSQRFRADDWAIFGCTILAVGFGMVAAAGIALHGGFATGQAFFPDFVSPEAKFVANVQGVLRGLQILFTARMAVFDNAWVAASRMLLAGIAVLLSVWVVLRMPRAPSGVSQLFVLAVSVVVFADAVSKTFNMAVSDGPGFPNAAIRYVIPVYVFMSLAATLEAQRIFFVIRQRQLRNTAVAILVIVALPFFYAAAQASMVAAHARPGVRNCPEADLTAWLLAHRFRYGLGDYWTSQMIFDLSQTRIGTVPVLVSGNRLALFGWNCDVSLWNHMQPPQFVVISPAPPPFTTATAEATYGAPQKIYPVGPYTVLQFASP